MSGNLYALGEDSSKHRGYVTDVKGVLLERGKHLRNDQRSCTLKRIS